MARDLSLLVTSHSAKLANAAALREQVCAPPRRRAAAPARAGSPLTAPTPKLKSQPQSPSLAAALATCDALDNELAMCAVALADARTNAAARESGQRARHSTAQSLTARGC